MLFIILAMILVCSMPNPSKSDKSYWQKLTNIVGCCICRFYHNIYYNGVSIHHIDGRTKPGAHRNVLPLCAGHHQTGGEGVAIHPYKRRWEENYGTQIKLKERCDRMIGE